MYGMMPQVNPNLFIGNTIPNALNAMADWRTRQIGNQYLPQQLANQNALTSQQVKYNPGMLQARNALAQQQANQAGINTQYLPAQLQTQINAQTIDPIAQLMQAQAMAAYRNQLVNYDQSRVMNALKGAPMVDSNGNPVGQTTAQQQVVNNLNNPQGGFNINSILAMRPYQNVSLPGNALSPGMAQQPMQPNMGPPQSAPMPQPQGQMPMQQQAPGMPMPQQSGAAQQNTGIRNPLTNTITWSNGQVTQPLTGPNVSFDQKAVAAVGRIQPMINQLSQLAQFQNLPANTARKVEGLSNQLFNTNFQAPEQYAQGQAALKTIPESMLKMWGLNGTGELYNAMQQSIQPQSGESPIQYQNRIYQTSLELGSLADQSGNRLKGGVTLKDFNPADLGNSDTQIMGHSLSDIVAYANKAGLTVPQVMQMIQQKQGATSGS